MASLGAPNFNAELAGLYALLGAILMPLDRSNPRVAASWLRRSVDAIPERPGQHA